MNTALVMSYSLAEKSLYNRKNNTSIEGSWLYELAKKYVPYETDKQISLIGFDSLKRVEIMISVNLFEQLKNDSVFIMHAENLRRLRTIKKDTNKSKDILEYLCYPTLMSFDNDLDKTI